MRRREFHVESQRLQQTLEKLSEFGRNPEGGVTRLGFSEADIAAREYVADYSGVIQSSGAIWDRSKVPVGR
jgi:hypothetical protein